MPRAILRFAAPVLVLASALGAFLAASYALGASHDDPFAYVVGIGFQFLAVGSVTAWLSAVERSNSEHWARTHVRQACLLYVVTAALILLWPNAGHGSACSEVHCDLGCRRSCCECRSRGVCGALPSQ